MVENIIKAKQTILVDADACPVTDIIVRVGRDTGLKVVLVASLAICLPEHDGVERVSVDTAPQAADMAIVNRVSAGDIVVTQDFGLAALVLAKNGQAISPRGKIYLEENIDSLLMQRHVAAKIRQGGGRTKGPKALEPQDLARFEKNLRKLIGAQ